MEDTDRTGMEKGIRSHGKLESQEVADHLGFIYAIVFIH